MKGIEVDFVVTDTLKALELYQKVFGAEEALHFEVLEKTALEKGMNEVVFSIAGSRFHMLDENPEAFLVAPKDGEGGHVWFNLVVNDIASVFARAEEAGFTMAAPVREMPGMGLKNSVQKDPFGYLWMLHEFT